ncbi:bifunctional serine/threonine-protein kinase/formylglycine-generating enzyme family protein [Limnoglobus roseus]|uniref:Putative serine/threonine protein kinase n=1 Tax=Limnoglobus roseus TaxID=2598579 RepID=A0A5C1AS27_9BACT|nr:bifunctional serine/threonine-protein kinase/formylglycine-generating enzyme family protein [Limnoglobus roseus]QEL20957.1 putative serine/threonine protein kinase [Limnoglobus roseus]
MAPVTSTTDFLNALAATGFLTDTQLAALKGWAQIQRPDANTIAIELNKRGWLTGYQIKEIYRGRGPGLSIGPYRVADLLGEGAMGRVFRATHMRLGREVALKVIRRDKLANPLTVRRFQQEIRAVAQLSHPNVVMAFDADEANGDHFLAMEFVDGTDLTKLVRERGPMPIPVACDYIRQAALGLHHAYERGMVHRDVKPSNIIAAKTGQVKVLDLGLAMLNTATASESSTRVTQEGFVLGTPDFLAPEQAQNPQQVDTRADVYALGTTLFYLLTGQTPYEGGNSTEKLLKHITDPPPQLLARMPTAPPQLDAIIQWMTAKDPRHRPQTPVEVAHALLPFCPPPPPGTHPHQALPPAPVAPVFALDPKGSSHLFMLPASEAPARIRERSRKSGSLTGWLVGLVALVTFGVGGYVVYRLAFLADPPPTAEYTNPLGMKLVLVPPGKFLMGSPDSERGRGFDEGPVGEVTLENAYYIGATEVTNGQFQQLMGKSPARTAVRIRGATDYPVETVTWAEAVEFCKKLTERDRTKRRGWAYRLPTEAEWEYACRAGTTTAYPSGDQLLPAQGETFDPLGKDDPPPDDPNAKSPGQPSKVGQAKANAFNLLDCPGNVAEWCSDFYARSYPAGPRVNPTGPATGDVRAVRGGAFDSPAARCRSAARAGHPPDTREPSIGFRVVLAPVP